MLLIREYTYIHPYNPGFGGMPRWTYTSTKTITWWFLLVTSLILITPLLRKQVLGTFGLILFIAVVVRPIMQNKFPEETVFEFYAKRKDQLVDIVNNTEINDHTIINQKIRNAGFEKVIVKDSIYYFFCYHEDFIFGICYSKSNSLPENVETFGRIIKFNRIEKDWYELDY